ncbi:alginate export family protein [candidate division KSB1 bacterium]|nr:alginate export family protein [candidate division KSB1 bacterium]
MKRILKVVLPLFLILSHGLIAEVRAQEKTVDISGQIRLRGESSDKDFDGATGATDYTLLRTRLNFQFGLLGHVTAYAQLQDSRVYGEEGADGATNTLTSISNVDLSQGYVQIDDLLFPWLAAKFGRLRLNYGAQRLIGANEFSNVGRSFDGVVVMLTFENFQIDLIHSTLYESSQAPDTLDGDQQLTGVWMTFNQAKSSLFHLYVLTDQDWRQNAAGDPRLNRATLGGRYENTMANWGLEMEANLQTGVMDFDRDILALYMSGALSYHFAGSSKPQLAIGVDYLSGDKADTEAYECFNTLFPARHKHFGYMDYFLNIPTDTRQLGLIDMMAKARLSPRQKFRLEGDLHFFRLSQDAGLSDGLSTDLGTELDMAFGYDYCPSVNFTLGGAAFLPGQVMKEWYGQDLSFWFYAQTTVNF